MRMFWGRVLVLTGGKSFSGGEALSWGVGESLQVVFG